MMGNFFETFYARGGRRSFRTAWATSSHKRTPHSPLHPGNAVLRRPRWRAAGLGGRQGIRSPLSGCGGAAAYGLTSIIGVPSSTRLLAFPMRTVGVSR